MKTPLIITMASLLCASAMGDEITQSHQYELDGTINTFDTFEFVSFDDLGGTRVLTDVRMNLSGEFDFVWQAENQESYALTTDDWFFDAHVATTLTLAGLNNGGIWNAGSGQLTANLAANDGAAGEGADYMSWHFNGEYETELFFIDDVFPAFITNGPGTIDGVLGIFNDLAITPGHQYNPDMLSQYQSGVFSLTYIYTTVPAPGSAAVMGLLALRPTRNGGSKPE